MSSTSDYLLPLIEAIRESIGNASPQLTFDGYNYIDISVRVNANTGKRYISSIITDKPHAVLKLKHGVRLSDRFNELAGAGKARFFHETLGYNVPRPAITDIQNVRDLEELCQLLVHEGDGESYICYAPDWPVD